MVFTPAFWAKPLNLFHNLVSEEFGKYFLSLSALKFIAMCFNGKLISSAKIKKVCHNKAKIGRILVSLPYGKDERKDYSALQHLVCVSGEYLSLASGRGHHEAPAGA